MKCPLRGLYIEKTSIGEQPDQRVCLERECAWWSEADKRCAVLVATAHLVGLVAIGDELLKKMPHKEQP